MLYIAKWKIALILGVCILGVLYALPNFFSERTMADVPDWLPNKQISLGLDLQGGSHLLLEVETDVVVEKRLQALEDLARSVLYPARIRYTELGVEGGNITFRLMEPSDFEEARRLLRDEDPAIAVERNEQGRVVLSTGEAAEEDIRRSAMQQSLEIIRRRIDQLGTREPTIQQQGEERIIVQVPGIDDPERLKELLGTTAQMTFHLADTNTTPAQARRGELSPRSMLLQSAEDGRAGQPSEYVVRKPVIVSGERLTNAQPSFQDGQPVVSFQFDTLGARQFGQATQENVGKPLAIVLDDKVISAPVIREPILGGQGVISGSFTTQQAQDLALLLRAGALPAPIKILEERTVGPGLGADSIEAGKIASAIGMVLVVVFMIAAYGLFGTMAVIALFFNIAIIFAALSILQATLTLPGIAGIVLTIGMAVDANVLVFERIREELKTAKGPSRAIDLGYEKALSAIIDANITTFMTALILFALGSGPVKGFAVTLGLGIITSVFTAIYVTRLFIVMWFERKRPRTIEV